MDNGQSGKITFFSIIMIVVLLLAAVIMIMVISEVTKKEKASLTIKIINDKNEPIDGALVFVDNKQLAYSQGGVCRYIYTSDDIGKRIDIKSQLKFYQDADTSLKLETNQMPVTLVMFRPLAALMVVAMDSATSLPLSGVSIYMGTDVEKSGLTGADGSFSLPMGRIRLNDDVNIRLETKDYQKAEKFIYVISTDQKETIALVKKTVAPPPDIQRTPSPSALLFVKKPIAAPPSPPTTESGPSKTEMETELPPAVAPKEDSAFIYYSNGDYGRALEIYRDLTAKTEWSVRADFWLYSADCALHSASDARGIFSTATLTDALKSADNAERFQNRVVEKWFPAVVQIKKGEANAYLCEANASNAARRTEYRQSALRCLNNGINILRNEKLIDNELYQFALKMRDRVASSY